MRREEVHVHGVERLERHQFRPGVDVLPDVHRADPQPSGEGRAHQLLGDECPLLGDLGFGAFQCRGVGVDHGLAHRLDRELLLVAIIVRFGELDRRHERLQLRHVRVVVELNQRRAFRDLLAGLEVDCGNEPRQLGREVGTAHRAQRPHRLELALPFGELRLGRRDGLGRNALGGDALLYHIPQEGLETEQPAEKHPDDCQHDDHALGHKCDSLNSSLPAQSARAAFAEPAGSRFHHPPPSAWNSAAVSA